MLRNKEKVIYPELSYLIYGFCFKIHNELGRFLNEKQYGDALEKLLKENKINYIREFALPLSFDGEKPRRNIVDFLIEDKIILEFKVKQFLTKEDYYQLKRYLVSSSKKLGILFNFRQQALSPKRILN
ncbi:MAG: GxxExxY protein [bacterium]|nr:GxxExxY protein [bacterium]